MTVLFADLVGSTALASKLDPEEYKDLLTTFHRMATAVLEAMGGRVAQYLGDGVLAYFGYPAAREDDAERAVRAALQLNRAMIVMEFGGATHALRIGIATGVVVVGETVRLGIGGSEHLIAGEVPNLAVRLQTLASAREIVIAHATRLLIGSLFSCRDLGMLQLKGFPAPVQVWGILGENAIGNRFGALRDDDTPLVGRVGEVELMTGLWTAALGGKGQVLVLRGEAGIGKSRLAVALRKFISRHQDPGDGTEKAAVLEVQASPHYANSSLYPVAVLIRRMARLDVGLPEDILRQRLADTVATLACPMAGETLAAMANLLGIEPDPAWPPMPGTARERNFAMLDAMQRLVEAMAAQRPVLLIVEDAQWLDASTLALLAQLAAACATARVAILVTERTGEQSPAGARAPGLGRADWLQQPHVTVRDLDPLRADETRALITAISPRPLPDALVEAIVRRTDGVPLFTEELVRSVIDSGRAVDGTEHDVENRNIPSTLLGALTARLDQAAGGKEIAQVASIAGRIFTARQIAAMRPGAGNSIAEGIERLHRARLVVRVGSGPEPAYRFRHALIQDAAYQSLLRRQRRDLHRALAEWLEQNRLTEVDATDETIATHYSGAGLFQAAIAARRRGAEAAFARGAQADAANLLGDALADLARLPENPARDTLELDLTMQRAGALSTAYSYALPEICTLYVRARELSQRLDDAANTSVAEFGLMFHNLILGNVDRAGQYADAMLMGVEQKPPQLQAYAYMAAGMAAAQQSRYVEACSNLKKCVDITLDQNFDWSSSRVVPDLWVFSRSYLAYMLAFRGEIKAATALTHEVLRACRCKKNESIHAYGYVLGLLFASKLYLLLNDAAAVNQISIELIDVARKHRYPYYAALGQLMQLWALADREGNEVTAAATKLSRDLVSLSSSGDVIGLQIFYLKLAEFYVRLGNKETALECLSHTLVGYNIWASESKRIMARVICMSPQSDLVGAERLCLHAISIARGQGATTLEVRAAIDCARIMARQNRYAEALALLDGISEKVLNGTYDGVQFAEVVKTIAAA